MAFIAADTVVLARRHVVARSRRGRRRRRAAACRRALLHRHRADRRAAGRPAGAARAGRMRLLQGGRRQAADGLLRARRQALGHGRDSRGLLLRHAARGLRALRADPGRPRSTACRCSADTGIAALLQRPGELHAGRPLLHRRGAGGAATCSSRPASIRSASPRAAAPARSSRNGSCDRQPPMDLVRRRHPPRDAVPVEPPLSARPHRRDARAAVRHALALLSVSQRARRTAFAAARPSGRGRRLHGRGGGLGAAELVRRAGYEARV